MSKLTFASCVWYSDRAYYGLCVLIKDIGRRLPLELACTRINRVTLISLKNATWYRSLHLHAVSGSVRYLVRYDTLYVV